jgi:4-hydroxymandelate oxidase
VSPGAGCAGLWLVGAERRVFAGSTGFLDDPANRADLATYLTDLTRPYPESRYSEGSSSADGSHSYGEMAEELIRTLVPADRPVDLLVLAYAIHDVQPGRATATYLSSVCPGTPLSFAISDQGTAAAFSGLRIVRDYLTAPVSSTASGAGPGAGRRALLIVLEQAGLPYPSAAARPAEHRGVAMLFDTGGTGQSGGPAAPTGRLVGLRQRPNRVGGGVAEQAAADLAELADGYSRVRMVAGPALVDAWPGRPDELRVGPAGQPATGVWWQLLDELGTGPDLLVAADYDPELGYLCLAGFEAGPDAAGPEAG